MPEKGEQTAHTCAIAGFVNYPRSSRSPDVDYIIFAGNTSKISGAPKRGKALAWRDSIKKGLVVWMLPRIQNSPSADVVFDEEQRLVSEVLRKERKATAEFVSRCTDYSYPLVRRSLISRAESVEDLLQEILLAAWQNLAGFRGDSSLRGWILGIARHKIDDYYRKRIRESEVQEDDDSETELASVPQFEEQLDAASQRDRVEKTLAVLPEAYALALLWRYRDGRSLREMAEITGKTEKAMERLLARARESFRRKWNDAESTL